MTIMIWLVLGALAIKLVWNMGVPYVLIKRAKETKKGRTSGVSMATVVEVVLLGIATSLSSVSAGEAWINKPLILAGVGFTAIVFTYLHLFVVGAIGGWLIARKQSPNFPTPSDPK